MYPTCHWSRHSGEYSIYSNNKIMIIWCVCVCVETYFTRSCVQTIIKCLQCLEAVQLTMGCCHHDNIVMFLYKHNNYGMSLTIVPLPVPMNMIPVPMNMISVPMNMILQITLFLLSQVTFKCVTKWFTISLCPSLTANISGVFLS